jgi:SAM-dependent methyltransferase
MTQVAPSYYSNKISALADLFGAKSVEVEEGAVVVDGRRFPVVDDVIVLLEPGMYTRHVADSLGAAPDRVIESRNPFASDIQSTFGQEWLAYPEVLTEHEDEFRQYFDLIDMGSLEGATVCDLGCGSGRWSHYLHKRCRRLILVDFSDAIFVARRNLQDSTNTLFFMGDLTNLPFRRQFADMVICLGVLHHLPVPALYAVRRLRTMAPRILVYLYYALDNRPAHFRVALRVVTAVRWGTGRLRRPAARNALAWAIAVTVYVPIVAVGTTAGRLRLGKFVPLHDTYKGKSLRRIRQDVYDRFFTRIEQRVSKASILKLNDTFSKVTISPNLPYWHFLCEAPADQPNPR